MNQEQYYDNYIQPLVDMIREIATDRGINFAMIFELDRVENQISFAKTKYVLPDASPSMSAIKRTLDKEFPTPLDALDIWMQSDVGGYQN